MRPVYSLRTLLVRSGNAGFDTHPLAKLSS